MSTKILFIVITALAGTSYVVYRKVKAIINKSSVNGLINSLRRNAIKPEDVIAPLDVPYGKRENCTQEEFEKLKSAIAVSTKIDEYTILYQCDADNNQYLLITEVVFSDFDIGVNGKPTDVSKKAYHSFVLRYEPDKQELSVWSDLHDGVTSKFQKEGFSRGVTKFWLLNAVHDIRKNAVVREVTISFYVRGS